MADGRRLRTARLRRWALAASGLASVGIAVIALTPAGTVAAPAALQSVMALLAMRSPGERGSALIDTKPARVRIAARIPSGGVPTERALGKVFGPGDIVPAEISDQLFVPPFQPDALDPIASASTPASIGPGPGGGLPGGNSGGPGPGGPGGGGSGGNPGGNDPGGGGGVPGSPPVAAVPEPATWLMMIFAFGGCGALLRRRRRVERAAVDVA